MNQGEVVGDVCNEKICRKCKHCIYPGDPNLPHAIYKCKLELGATGDRENINPEDFCFNGYFEQKENINEIRQVYETIKDILRFYLDIEEENMNIIALWIIGSWFHNNFNTYPYLFLNAMRGSGKSRTLKLISSLQNNGEVLTSLTEAVMFRQNNPLSIDEFEGLGSKDKNSIRELLNTAYKKGSKVKRAKKKKTIDGEEQVIDTFDPYRPICLANIWGMEEVLGDRCINIILEKSSDSSKTKLIEDFENMQEIQDIRLILAKMLKECSLCSVVSLKNVYRTWNNYIKHTYSITTLTTLTNYTTLTPLTTQEKEMFDLIKNTEINGRNFELFFPLFMIAEEIGRDVLVETIKYAERIVNNKKSDEITESKDVMLYSMIAQQETGLFYTIKGLTEHFKQVTNEDLEWLNAKWMGRALKRLNLIVDKRRRNEGVEVTLDVNKAKKKEEMFKPKK